MIKLVYVTSEIGQSAVEIMRRSELEVLFAQFVLFKQRRELTSLQCVCFHLPWISKSDELLFNRQSWHDGWLHCRELHISKSQCWWLSSPPEKILHSICLTRRFILAELQNCCAIWQRLLSRARLTLTTTNWTFVCEKIKIKFQV